MTGCCGFIGSWLAEALVRHGHDVYGADSMVGGRNITLGMPLHVGDLSDVGFSRHVADVVQPRVLVHLAADPREGASYCRPDSVTRNNLAAFCCILEACLRHGLDRCVVFSSMSVYGNQDPPFTEVMDLFPVDPYGVNKAAMEAIVEQMADFHEFGYVIIRPHNVVGPRQFIDPIRNVATIFSNSAVRGEPMRIFGDGLNLRAFSNIRDSLPCYVEAIETGVVEGEAINVGGEQPVTILELAQEVQRLVPESRIEHVRARYGEVPFAFSSHEKAKRLLGFEEKHGWREAIREVVEWVKRDGPFDWEPVHVVLQNHHTPEHWVPSTLEATVA